MSDFDEFMETWKERESIPISIFSVVISEDEPTKDNLYKTYIPKTGKHSDKISLTIAIGDTEGAIPHMHIWHGMVKDPTHHWKESIRLQFKKSQYYESLGKNDPLSSKEAKILAQRLDEQFGNTDHTLWEELIYRWNSETKKKKGDEHDGWLHPSIRRPKYEDGISLYK